MLFCILTLQDQGERTNKAMISYNLRCDNEHEFEGWFRDAAAFDAQAAQDRLECPVCGARSISKALSAPNISTGRSRERARMQQAAKAAHAALRELRRKIERDAENVGDKFAEEARRIHYGEAEKRDIYGRATLREAQELTEEGVSFGILPFPDRTEH